jgi:hypothetical protein
MTADTPQIPQPDPSITLPSDTERRAVLSGLIEQMMANIHRTNEVYEKSQAAVISFMDRLVILAGGTLTLLFTVVSSVGPRLGASHLAIRHPELIIQTSWALVG